MSEEKNFEALKELIVKQLGVEAEAVTQEASFIDDLGADSLDTVELVMNIEDKFGIDIPESETETIKTVQDALNFVNKALAEKGE